MMRSACLYCTCVFLPCCYHLGCWLPVYTSLPPEQEIYTHLPYRIPIPTDVMPCCAKSFTFPSFQRFLLIDTWEIPVSLKSVRTVGVKPTGKPAWIGLSHGFEHCKGCVLGCLSVCVFARLRFRFQLSDRRCRTITFVLLMYPLYGLTVRCSE